MTSQPTTSREGAARNLNRAAALRRMGEWELKHLGSSPVAYRNKARMAIAVAAALRTGSCICCGVPEFACPKQIGWLGIAR